MNAFARSANLAKTLFTAGVLLFAGAAMAEDPQPTAKPILTSGKLALHLKNRGRRPLLVPCDVYRPAAIEQLRIVAKGVNVPFFEIGEDRDPLSIARRSSGV